MTGNRTRGDSLFREHAQRGDRNRADGRLLEFGQFELVFGALEAEIRKREAQSVVGFLEGAPGDGKFLGQIPAHAGVLRILSWKKKGEVRHLCGQISRRVPSVL